MKAPFVAQGKRRLRAAKWRIGHACTGVLWREWDVAEKMEGSEVVQAQEERVRLWGGRNPRQGAGIEERFLALLGMTGTFS